MTGFYAIGEVATGLSEFVQGPTYTLIGGSCAFLLTASPARLLLARRLVAEAAGSLAITTATAGLRATRRLPIAAASFSLTGSTATFFYSPIDTPGTPTYTLTAVGGTLGLTGTGVGMRARRRLSGSAGQFVLTGWDAVLALGQKIEYARAPAGSGYTAQRTESTHRPTSAATARPAALQRNNR